MLDFKRKKGRKEGDFDLLQQNQVQKFIQSHEANTEVLRVWQRMQNIYTQDGGRVYLLAKVVHLKEVASVSFSKIP